MMIQIPIMQLRFQLQALTPVQFPAYSGSTWRGLFGRVLKRVVCVTGLRDCRSCLLWRQCSYAYLFETPPPPVPESILSAYDHAPHPFVFRCAATDGKQYGVGDLFSVDLLLFGQAQQQLGYLIYTLQAMGDQGIGRGNGLFALCGVQQATAVSGGEWLDIYQAGRPLQAQPALLPVGECWDGQGVQLVFKTPYRAVNNGRLLDAAHFSARAFLSTLLRRLSLLQLFHTGEALRLDFRALLAQADALELADQQLYWHDWARYSSRQNRAVKMGGLLGSVTLRGGALASLWPFLEYGQWVHTGKGTVMGLGHYALQAVD